MKRILTVFFAVLSLVLSAQQVPDVAAKEATIGPAIEVVTIRCLINPMAFRLPDRNVSLEFFGNFFANSNSVTSAFSNAFINPRFIDEELKLSSYDRLAADNRFGMELSYGVSAVFYPDSSWRANRKAFRIQFKQDNLFAAAFTNDVFRLFFSGNAAYANMDAKLGSSAFYNLRSRSFYVDYLQTHNLSSFSVGLAFIQGNSLVDTRIDEGSLFTASDGSFLDLYWKGNAMLSSASALNSPGFAARMSVGKSFGRYKRWQVQFKAEDIGFINWNSETTLINADTSLRFTGLQFNDLFNTEWGTVEPSDSLRRIFTGKTITGSEMAALPWLVQGSLSYSGGNNANYLVVLNARYRSLPGMKPLVELQLHQKLFEHLDTRLTGKLGISAGGFGKMNSQIGIGWEGNKQAIRAEITALEGLLAPQKLSGSGLFLNYILKL